MNQQLGGTTVPQQYKRQGGGKEKIERMREMINKDLEELKNKQTEMTNTITEMKTTLEGINSRKTGQKN